MELSLDSVSFDTQGWTPHVQQPAHRSWYTAERDAVLVRLMPHPSPEETVTGWRERATHETAINGGTWVDFEEDLVDRHRAFRGLFKFPAARLVPEAVGADSLAVYVVGLIVVPLREQHVLVHVEALERGTTGAREAAYGVTQPRPTEIAADAGEPWDRFRAALSVKLPSDEERYDPLAPTHPLSRVRAHQRRILRSMKLSVP
jgi:hypothetical protein